VIAQRRAASPATWLKTHAAFAVPLGQAVNAAGGPVALADDPDAHRR
jgi:2-dehydropantoate 2-reductase